MCLVLPIFVNILLVVPSSAAGSHKGNLAVAFMGRGLLSAYGKSANSFRNWPISSFLSAFFDALMIIQEKISLILNNLQH